MAAWDERPYRAFVLARALIRWDVMRNRPPLGIPVADRRLLGSAAIAGAWALVALAATVQAVALVRLDGRSDVVGAVVSRVSIIPLWALATPLIFRSARWYPVVDRDRRVSPSALALHLVLASLFIVATNVLIRVPAALAPIAEGGGWATLGRSTLQGVAEYYPPAMVVYGVIVAIGHVLFRPAAGTLAAAAAPVASGPVEPAVARPSAADDGATAATLGGVDGRQGTAEPPLHDSEPRPESPSAAVAALDGHITVRQWNRVHLVRVEDIDFVEAEDNYVVVHAASRTYKGRDRISDVESQLDARRFVRIHRSTIVHLAKIREVQPLTHGDHAVILRNGKVLRVARSRRQALGQALGVEL